MAILSSEDMEFLNANYEWEQLQPENEKTGILIKNYPLPNGYRPKKSDLMLLIPNNYPIAGIDMFYFEPAISRNDGKAISKLAGEDHFERSWQRWSRHYDWCPNTDTLVKHVYFVRNQLILEIRNNQ